jgi:hypothetical protein
VICLYFWNNRMVIGVILNGYLGLRALIVLDFLLL